MWRTEVCLGRMQDVKIQDTGIYLLLNFVLWTYIALH